MKLPSIQQALFYTAGAAASVGSMIGTHDFIAHETGDMIMAKAGSLALSVGIYFAWDIALNDVKQWRIGAALSIALTCSAISTWTIYQNTARLEAHQQYTLAATQSDKQAARETEAAQAIKAQQADTRAAIHNLRQEQADDQRNINARTVSVGKGIRPNANNAAIATLEKAKTRRAGRIDALQAQLTTLTGQLVALNMPSVGTAPAVTPDSDVALDWAQLARAALYDALAALFLIFGSWYKARRVEAAQTEVVSAQAAREALTAQTEQAVYAVQQIRETTAEANRIARASIQEDLSTIKVAIEDHTREAQSLAEQFKAELQQATVTCNKAIAAVETRTAGRASPVAGPLQPATGTATRCNGAAMGILSDEEALQLIRSESIPTNEAGLVTVDEIKKATGWGRNRAESLLKSCVDSGLLQRSKRGSGFVHHYPARDGQMDLITNVISLNSAREVR